MDPPTDFGSNSPSQLAREDMQPLTRLSPTDSVLGNSATTDVGALPIVQLSSEQPRNCPTNPNITHPLECASAGAENPSSALSHAPVNDAQDLPTTTQPRTSNLPSSRIFYLPESSTFHSVIHISPSDIIRWQMQSCRISSTLEDTPDLEPIGGVQAQPSSSSTAPWPPNLPLAWLHLSPDAEQDTLSPQPLGDLTSPDESLHGRSSPENPSHGHVESVVLPVSTGDHGEEESPAEEEEESPPSLAVVSDSTDLEEDRDLVDFFSNDENANHSPDPGHPTVARISRASNPSLVSSTRSLSASALQPGAFPLVGNGPSSPDPSLPLLPWIVPIADPDEGMTFSEDNPDEGFAWESMSDLDYSDSIEGSSGDEALGDGFARRTVATMHVLDEKELLRYDRVCTLQANDAEDRGRGAACSICWESFIAKEPQRSQETLNEPSFGDQGQPFSSIAPNPSAVNSLPLEDMENKPIALPCTHVFHSACMIQWLSRAANMTCPECRHNLTPVLLPQREIGGRVPIDGQTLNFGERAERRIVPFALPWPFDGAGLPSHPPIGAPPSVEPTSAESGDPSTSPAVTRQAAPAEFHETVPSADGARMIEAIRQAADMRNEHALSHDGGVDPRPGVGRVTFEEMLVAKEKQEGLRCAGDCGRLLEEGGCAC